MITKVPIYSRLQLFSCVGGSVWNLGLNPCIRVRASLHYLAMALRPASMAVIWYWKMESVHAGGTVASPAFDTESGE